MKKTILLFIILMAFLQLKSQVTFERIFDKGRFNSVIEMSGPSYVLCGPDSVSHGAIYQIDRFGSGIISTYYPQVRADFIDVNDFTRIPFTGGFAISGHSPDTSGFNATGLYLLINSSGQNTDSIFYSGGATGPDATSILRTNSNDLIVGVETGISSGVYSSTARKVFYPSTGSWSVAGGSNMSNNGMDIDASDNLLLAGYNLTTATSADLKLYSPNGILLHTFVITDTAYGSSQVNEACAANGPVGTYIFGVDLNPSLLSYNLPYINCLDTGFNVLWEKYLDWGFRVNLVGMIKTSDSCIAVLLETDNGLAVHKLRANGDSLWTQFHHRPTSGYGSRFRECSDKGFIIAGWWRNPTFVSYQYVLKTDSLARLLPPAEINSSTNIICPGDSIQISAVPGYTYLWSTSETTQSIYVSQPQGYTVMVSDTNSLTALSDTFLLSNYSVQAASITFNGSILTAIGSGTYQWYLFNSPIVGADSSTYEPILEGPYTVEVTDSNGCISTSAPYIITGIDEISNRTFIFETSEYLIVNSKNGIREISIYDLTGKLVVNLNPNTSNIKIEKNELKRGVYIVSVRNNEGTVERKIFERNY